MVWFMVDDGFTEHPKTLSIPRTARLNAVGLWTMSGIWASRQMTDGRLTNDLVLEKGGRTGHIKALVESGLWHDETSVCMHAATRCPGIPDQRGLVFHDWYDWQRSRAQILGERQRKAAAGKAGGRASGASRRNQSRSRNEAPASPVVQPPVHVPHPPPNPSLTKIVLRRLFGDGPRETAVEDLIPLWRSAVGAANLEVELRNFLIHNADTELRNPAAALLGWLARAAERAAAPGPRPVLGCAECASGWLPDDPETGMPRPCPTCKPHRYVS
ncbi:hypothetical protein Kisp01_66030 [Kineosporia sp. NBRC 101677]|uniref:hypothetical protein n=1 Tax=Kineosporia sp. NBRC 101677 TaxID=3032197 RepID=UPI0024A17692|nr:hypothetical protein [Kineosporia sp. NBRC 101677]GLY19589.1 hypothetical protein Kisp01_66030 [Kineosporia sp. NBRC 101677]